MIDINVWLALTWEGHPQHASAARWYDSVDRGELWFCRLTVLGLLRLLTNEKVMGDDTLILHAAFEIYDDWQRDPRVKFAAEPRGVEQLFRLATAPFEQSPATKAVADCYLVGFAEAGGAHLVTFDKALAGTAGFRQVPVTLLAPL